MSPLLKPPTSNRRNVGRQRIGHRHAGNRRIAGIADVNRPAHHLADHIGRAAGNRAVLHDRQCKALRHRNRGVVADIRSRRCRAPSPCCQCRRRRRHGVELGLRHRVAGRVVPGLPDVEQIVRVGVAAVKAADQQPAPRWSSTDRSPSRRQPPHCRIVDRQRLAHHLADHIGRAAGNRAVLLD